MEEPGNKLPTHPKLRPIDMGWIEHEGKAYISLRDPMSLSQQGLAVPKPLAPFLSLCDGTRDLSALQIAFALTSGALWYGFAPCCWANHRLPFSKCTSKTHKTISMGAPPRLLTF